MGNPMVRDWRSPFLLGPLGALRELPCLPSPDGLEAGEKRTGAEHTSLYGGRTRDTFAVRRMWDFEWPRLSRSDRAVLRAWSRGLQREPLRLVDSFETNLLTADVSTCGGESRSSDAFNTGDGEVEYRPTSSPPDAFEGIVDSSLRWTVPEGDGTERLRHRDSGTSRTPVVHGERITFSAYARGAGDVRAVLTPYDRNGDSGDDEEGSTVRLDSGWRRVTVTFSPNPGDASLVASLVADQDADGEQIIDTTGWQLELGGSHSDWELGVGCPHVLVDFGDETYRKHGRYDVTFAVREV